MRCDRSPAEIFAAVALMSSMGRIARETSHQPPARPNNKIPAPTAVSIRAVGAQVRQFGGDGTPDQNAFARRQ